MVHSFLVAPYSISVNLLAIGDNSGTKQSFIGIVHIMSMNIQIGFGLKWQALSWWYDNSHHRLPDTYSFLYIYQEKKFPDRGKYYNFFGCVRHNYIDI